jgi:hypothetical protein
MNSVKPVSALEITPQGLSSLLVANRLTVPRYQRAFSWEEEQVSSFLSDVNSAYANGEVEYFMGTVVLQGSEGSYSVVDGQQRLTTASVFIAAARDFLHENGQEQVAKALEAEFLQNTDTWSQQKRSKLTLSSYDNDFYLKAVLGREVVEPRRESHQRLLVARGRCSRFIAQMKDAHTDWFERLHGFCAYLEHKVRVIQVVAPNEANAYVIFETLNDRGKDLSASDLLKNYLFGRAGERLDEVQSNWNQMLGTLEGYGGDDLVITYIRQVWSATREVAREKELFARIQSTVQTPQQAVDFSAELLKRSEHYVAMLNPSHPLWKEHGSEAQALIDSINLLKIERYRPALLSLIGSFSGVELVKAMRFILNGSVRYLVAIGAGGGSLEGAYSDAARKVANGHVTTAEEFAKEMSKIIPNDDVFRGAFESLRVSKAFLARYFLRALERAERGEENCELVPNADTSAVSLEHVLPEHPGGNWPSLSAEEAEALSRRLGNLVLLATKKNNSLGNQSFIDKKPILSKSDFLLTKEVGASEGWGTAEIEARQKRLSQLAVKVWPFKAGS